MPVRIYNPSPLPEEIFLPRSPAASLSISRPARSAQEPGREKPSPRQPYAW